MSDWPPFRATDAAAGSVLSTATTLSMAGHSVIAPASAGWPAANLALFVPVRVAQPTTICKLVVGAGATAAGNFDVGLYDSLGTKLVSSGATAKGASVEHVIDITDTQIGPGTYYLAMSADGTNNYVMWLPSGAGGIPTQKLRLIGVMEMATAYPLPATATFAAVASSTLAPAIAAYGRGY